MQDRYAGDIGDFGKFGLLQALSDEGFRIGVNWYKTSPIRQEIAKDGRFKQSDGRYSIPTEVERCNKELADILRCIEKGGERSIAALQRENLVKDAVYYSEAIPRLNRNEWHRNAVSALSSADIVFLDPDNGLLPVSVKNGSERSVKYAYYEELGDYLNNDCSVLVYQHRCRKKRRVYYEEIEERMEKAGLLRGRTLQVITFPKRSVRDYFALGCSSEHSERIQAVFERMINGVWGDSGMCRHDF